MEYLSAKFGKDGECTVWLGWCAGRDGDRPRVSLGNGRSYSVYRLLMAKHLGCAIDELPPIHHKCANTRCVTLDHLQPVTTRENNAEMMERQFYKKRIKDLEAALKKADPLNPLLKGL